MVDFTLYEFHLNQSHVKKPALTWIRQAAHRVRGGVAFLQDHVPFGTPEEQRRPPSVFFLKLLPSSQAAGHAVTK